MEITWAIQILYPKGGIETLYYPSEDEANLGLSLLPYKVVGEVIDEAD